MIRKKSSFLTFFVSMIPGAGEMYMGFMKRGLSLMSYFFFTLFIGSWLSIGPILFIVPILWFYSFFDTHNLRAMPDDEFYAMEDSYILIPKELTDKAGQWQIKYRNLAALALIFIGFFILWNNTLDMFGSILPPQISDILFNLTNYFPQFIVGCGILYFGLYLIRGKKIELDRQSELPENKGGDHI